MVGAGGGGGSFSLLPSPPALTPWRLPSPRLLVPERTRGAAADLGGSSLPLSAPAGAQGPGAGGSGQWRGSVVLPPAPGEVRRGEPLPGAAGHLTSVLTSLPTLPI